MRSNPPAPWTWFPLTLPFLELSVMSLCSRGDVGLVGEGALRPSGARGGCGGVGSPRRGPAAVNVLFLVIRTGFVGLVDHLLILSGSSGGSSELIPVAVGRCLCIALRLRNTLSPRISNGALS